MENKVQCPNCLGEAEKIGDKIVCVTCDATFKITRTGGANVVNLGRVETLEKRVGALEALFSTTPKDQPGPGEQEEEDDII